MPHVFPCPTGNGASIVFLDDTLTETQKAKGIKVDKLPEPESIAGKQARLNGNKETGEVFYEYVDVPVEPESELETRIMKLENLLVTKGIVKQEEMEITK